MTVGLGSTMNSSALPGAGSAPVGGATDPLAGLPTSGATSGASASGMPTSAAGTAPAGTSPVGMDPAAAGGALTGVPGTTPASKDPTEMFSTLRFLGPIAAIGGAALAIAGFRSGGGGAVAAGAEIAANATKGTAGKPWMRWLGIGTGLTGLGLTAYGFKANGIHVGKQAGVQEGMMAYDQQFQTQVAPALDQKFNELMTMLQQKDQELKQAQAMLAQGGGAQTGAAGDPNATGAPTGQAGAAGPAGAAGQVAPSEPGIGGTSSSGSVPVPGQGAGDATGGNTGVAGASGPGASNPGAATTPGATPGGSVTGSGGAVAPADPGPVTPQALVGKSIILGEAISDLGKVADKAMFVISQPIGDAAGYADLAQADAAAKSAMSTNSQGISGQRWVVIEQNGKFYPFVATAGTGQEPPLPQTHGNVVGWHALRYVGAPQGQMKWVAYDWSASGQSSFREFVPGSSAAPNGQASAPSGPANAPSGQTGTTPGTTSQVPAQGNQVVGGGGSSQVPQAVLGRTFEVATTYAPSGATIRGGQLQIQRVVAGSEAGYATPEEATSAAMADRAKAGDGDKWQRWVTMQGSDGRYYSFFGSIVGAATSPLSGGAAPMHIFSNGAAQYFNGSAWVAQAA